MDRITLRRYIVVTCIAIILLPKETYAQFDPQIGHYTFITNAYNPAAAGEDDLMKVAGMYRLQYTGITNAPRTLYFMFSSPFVIGKTKHGAGVKFMNDTYGLFKSRAFEIQYCYRHKIGKGYLSAGVDLGFVSLGFQGDSVNLEDLKSDYHQTDDPLIVNGEQNGMNFDLALGLYYTTEKWFAGISYSHVTYPEIYWSEQSTVRIRGTMYVNGGYNWKLPTAKKWILKPSALLMTDFSAWDLTLTALAEYNERWRFGLNYRIRSSVGILLGMDIISGLQLGYTYEIPTNRLITRTYGSHEVYLAYGFNILRPKRNNKYKSVRYL